MGIMQQKVETTVQYLRTRVEGVWWENEMENKMAAMETPLGLIVIPNLECPKTWACGV